MCDVRTKCLSLYMQCGKVCPLTLPVDCLGSESCRQEKNSYLNKRKIVTEPLLIWSCTSRNSRTDFLLPCPLQMSTAAASAVSWVPFWTPRISHRLTCQYAVVSWCFGSRSTSDGCCSKFAAKLNVQDLGDVVGLPCFVPHVSTNTDTQGLTTPVAHESCNSHLLLNPSFTTDVATCRQMYAADLSTAGVILTEAP